MIECIRFKRGQQQAQYLHLEPHFAGNAFFPHYALVPLEFQTQTSSLPIVSVGDFVHEGQLIARADKNTSVHVHAPVPGTVAAIIDTKLSNGQVFRGLRIRTGGSFKLLGKKHSPYPWETIEQTELIRFLESTGLVNTVKNTVSLAHTVRNAIKAGITALTVVLYDKDPTCVLDSFLAGHFTREIAKGIDCIAYAMRAEKITIETSTGKKGKAVFNDMCSLITNRNLVHLTASRVYPAETDTIRLAEKNAVAIDASTALEVYESVQYNQPMLTTYLLITGKTVEQAAIVKVRIGTPIRHLIQTLGGFKSKNTHIIINGLLHGTLVDSLDLPAGKGIKSVHAVGTDTDVQQQLGECGHCGQCLCSCPAYIDPINTVRHIQKKHYTVETQRAISLCNGCACCSAVCPERIPLSAIIKSAVKQGHCDAL